MVIAAKAPHVTKAEIARRIGLSYKALAGRIRGSHPFYAAEIVLLSKEFDTPVGQLLGTEPLELDQ